MLRSILLLFVLVLAGCSESVDSGRPANKDLFPLAVGNEWKYARVKFVRGSEAERDTVTLRVVSRVDDDEFIVERASQYAVDSLHVQRKDQTNFDIDNNALISYGSEDPFTSLLIATTDIIPNMRSYFTLSDTTYTFNPALRLREHVELFDNNGDVVLRLDFDHVFVEGLGQVAVRFVADINECLQCSLISEFWVYELVSYSVQ